MYIVLAAYIDIHVLINNSVNFVNSVISLSAGMQGCVIKLKIGCPTDVKVTTNYTDNNKC